MNETGKQRGASAPKEASSTELVVWRGELTPPRRLRVRGLGLVLPGAVWILIFLVLPSVVLLALAFAQRGTYGDVVWKFTLENFRRLAGYGLMGWTGDNARIFVRSVWVAAVSTLLALVLAYPLAFFIAARPARTRYMWLALVIIPFCTNLVIRTYALMLLLSHQWPPALLAQKLGLIEPNMGLYPSDFAIYLGMLSSSLPFAALPLYTNVERLDWELVEAARDLYAGRWGVFRHAILPQTLPGLGAAVILTFIPALGALVVPDLLGGAKTMLLGNLIQQTFQSGRDWPFGAAISFALMLLTLAGMFALRGKRRGALL